MLPDTRSTHDQKDERMLNRSPYARSAVTDEGLVLLDVSTGNIFQSNPVGSRIWLKLQDGAPVSRIVDEISAEFDAARGEVEADVSEFITQLMARDLIVESK
jgi:hypothetical protein